MSDYAVRMRTGLPTAVWGMIILIASEATLFSAFIAVYFYLRFTSPGWPQDGLPAPAVAVPTRPMIAVEIGVMARAPVASRLVLMPCMTVILSAESRGG